MSRILRLPLSFRAGAVFLSFATVLLSCEDGDPLKASKVNPDAIWTDFRGTWDESADQVGLAVQFRLKGPNGRPIRLDGASRLTLPTNGIALVEQKGGAFGFDGMAYSVTLSQKGAALEPESVETASADSPGATGETAKLLEQSHRILWVRSDETELEAEVTLSRAPRLDPASLPTSIKRSAGFAARFILEDERERQAFLREEVHCVLVALGRPDGADPTSSSGESGSDPNPPVVTTPEPDDTPVPAAEILTEMRSETSRTKGCIFDAASLKNFRVGPAELKVITRQERPTPAAFARKARVVSESISRGTWMTVSD